MKYILLIIFFIATSSYVYGRSVVYNFRIAQITKEHIFDPDAPKKKHTVIGLLFDEISQKRYDDIHSNFLGGLGALIYNWEAYFLRADFATSYIKQKSFNSYFSDVQTDDILFTFGKNFKINEKEKITVSGLFGIPTHQVYALQKPGVFGFGQFGIGTQLDSNYNFNSKNSLLLGGRYVYFVPRNAKDMNQDHFKFTAGNLIDFLIASKNVWGKQGLEIGYTPRFSFGAKVSPNLDKIVEKNNYIRSTWYGVYQYRFMINNVVNRFLFNIASGFDHVPKKYGHKYIVFLWAAWDIKF